MDRFKTLFGLPSKDIRPICVLTPFLTRQVAKSFGVRPMTKGYLYRCAQHPRFSLIHTGQGPCLTGDAVLYLQKSPCRYILFFGSCGITPWAWAPGTSPPRLVIPRSALAMEGFSPLLGPPPQNPDTFHPDKQLLQALRALPYPEHPSVAFGHLASFGSLKLEENYLSYFQKNAVLGVDMECSAVFAAAKACGKKAIALLFVTDVIGRRPFYYERHHPENQRDIQAGIQLGGDALKAFIEKLTRKPSNPLRESF